MVVSDRTEPDMSFELFEPDKSPVQLKPDFWLEPMSRTLWYLSFKNISSAKHHLKNVHPEEFTALFDPPKPETARGEKRSNDENEDITRTR